MGILYEGLFCYGVQLPQEDWFPFLKAVYQTEMGEVVDEEQLDYDDIRGEVVNRLWAERGIPLRLFAFFGDINGTVLVVATLYYYTNVWKGGDEWIEFILPKLDTGPWDQLLHHACQAHRLHPVKSPKFYFGVSSEEAWFCYGLPIAQEIPSELPLKLHSGVVKFRGLLAVNASINTSWYDRVTLPLPALESWLKPRNRLITDQFRRYRRPPPEPQFQLLWNVE